MLGCAGTRAVHRIALTFSAWAVKGLRKVQRLLVDSAGTVELQRSNFQSGEGTSGPGGHSPVVAASPPPTMWGLDP